MSKKMQEEKQQLFIILLITFIGFVGASIAYPIFPPLFLHPTLGSIIPSTWSDHTRSILLGVALAAYPLGQFIGSPILGGCSDRYGRKRILMFSLAGSMIGYLFTALSLQLNWIGALLASRFLTGLMESNLAIARAMVTDLNSISKYKSFGRINGVAAIGYVMGPILGGFLSERNLVSWFSFAFPFYLATFFSIITLLLAAKKLTEKKHEITYPIVSIWQRFNLIARIKALFKTSVNLKHLLLISTIFTFAVDIFYEFGPVYLTGLWSMTPAGIAVYNGILSLTLAIGSGWLTHRLSLYFSAERIIIIGMFITAMILGLMVVWPSLIFAFILFGLVGLSIAVVNVNITIQISNTADKSIQGEAMGTQLSLRMLGDALICLVGGFVIIASVALPIAAGCMIALMAAGMYGRKL
ncbi:MAG: MFS transporter [Gammaproteobacteria bacterium]|nr:MAG: MFS transporter [Gammaproteobacteria bacterium]